MHYRLQFNAYTYMLEKYYGQVVASMAVICTHPDNGSQPFIDVVPRMTLEIEQMMHEQRRIAQEITRMETEDWRLFDPLGGASQGSWSMDANIEQEEELLLGVSVEENRVSHNGMTMPRPSRIIMTMRNLTISLVPYRRTIHRRGPM